MALAAVCAKLKSPIFSIKRPETFQIAASLPVPQPSTLVGALAYCVGVHQGIGLEAQELVKRLVVAARAKLMSGAVATVNPIILRRFRILDKGLEDGTFGKACEALSRGDFDAFRRVLERELVDALYREHLSYAILKCVWVLKSSLESKLLYLLQRLGDTESLVTVTEAWSAECKTLYGDATSTEYPFAISPELVREISGSYTVLKMCNEERKLETFCVPCRKEVGVARDGAKYFIYVPSRVDVKFKGAGELLLVDDEPIVRGVGRAA